MLKGWTEMVDVNKLRKKFPTRNPQKAKSRAAIKAIAREYEMKRAELGGAPGMRRGFPYYMAIILGMLVVGALVVPQLMQRGDVAFDIGGKRIADAKKMVKALATALGRYRYHTGVYPSTGEGLAALAFKLERPELQKVPVKGWNGPYIKKLVDDPWRNAFVYVDNGEGETPTLYSKGPDGAAGTTDDIIADPADFDAPFRDTSWTKGWMPQYLRGYVVAQNEAHKASLLHDVDAILNPETNSVEEAKRVIPGSLEFTTLGMTDDSASMRAVYSTREGVVTNDFAVGLPIAWTPSRPFLHHVELAGEEFAFPVRTVVRTDEGGVLLNGGRFEPKGVRLEGPADGNDPWRGADGMRLKLMRLKEMGTDTVFVAEADAILRGLCDQLGFLVLREGGESFPAEGQLFDPLGEPNGRFMEMRSVWNKDDDTIDLGPHWNWKEGETVRVVCATSGDEAELFVNNESKGRRSGAGPYTWDVPFEAGSLKAIVYKNGRYLGEREVLTTGKAFALKLSADRQRLGNGETAFVLAEVVDEDGRALPSDPDAPSPAPEFKVEGPGVVAGVRQTASKAVVAVRRTGGSGLALEVKATAKGLVGSSLKLPME